jgi:ABC-2 type transport system ATP-binding protein
MELRLLDVSHRYGGHTALDGVSLHVRSGDCYGFLGHNGAGKTTAMRIALGLMRPSSGRILVDGFDAAEHPVEARSRMGGLIEAPGFHPGINGLRNLELLARVQGLSSSQAAEESARVLREVGLLHAATKPVGAYSQGMRQRLGIAQALLGRPAIVLLDEPTNGLDPEGIEQMRALLRRLTRDEGTTVLLSSHQLHELSGLCNRVAILREGRLLLEDETDHLLSDRRHLLRAGDDAAAKRVLDALGLAAERTDDGWLVPVPEEGASRILAALVEGAAAPYSFAPRIVSLEDVYLRHTRNGAPTAPAGEAVATASAPAETRAPRAGTARAAGYELRRWRASRTVAATLALPAVAGAAAIALRKVEASGFTAEVSGGELASTTDVTAFEAVGTGLQSALPVLALVAAGLASQSLAGEMARGTLRNLVLRPLRRVHVALGKVLAGLATTTVAYVFAAGVVCAVSGLLFDFTDVTEILFNGERFPLVPADELHGPLREVLLRPLPALLAFSGLGFLAGAVTRSPAPALGLALGLLVVPDALRSVLRGFDVEWAVPSAHAPTALGDTSFVAHYLDLARGVSNTSYETAGAAIAVPLVWLVGCVVLAAWALSRRAIR